jgi:hypothetical protein
MVPEEEIDLIVIGGGASGMMAAGVAAAAGKRVLLLEKNRRLGEKLRISGGGRCNITNAEKDEKKLLAHYGDAEQFLYSAFAQFGAQDTFTFFESRGLPLMVEAGNRAFPKSDKALDVVNVLTAYLERGGVQVRTGAGVTEVAIAAGGGAIGHVAAGGKKYTAKHYLFATGGVSHKETGSTGDAFPWLKKLGHTLIDPTPTIVPLKVQETWVRTMAGMSLPGVKCTFRSRSGAKLSRTGSVLLTHFGISGPTILNAAGKVADLLHEGAVSLSIDLYPGLDLGILDQKIRETFDENKNKLLRNVLKELVPAGTTEGLLALVPEIDPETKVHSVTKEERRQLAELLKGLPLTVTGLMGLDRAVVADGGVPLTEVDMKTMRSKKSTNLSVTGDLLHIQRPSGGYSLQLCWTTGYVAATNLPEKI